MKKLLYSVLFAAIVSLTISSCTEDEVTPQEMELNNGGANTAGDKI